METNEPPERQACVSIIQFPPSSAKITFKYLNDDDVLSCTFPDAQLILKSEYYYFIP